MSARPAWAEAGPLAAAPPAVATEATAPVAQATDAPAGNGRPLRDVVAPQPGLPTLLELALQLARALARLHQRGLCHRQVRPSQILVFEAATPGAPGWRFDFKPPVADSVADPHKPPETTASELACMAPEQTGRTGRPVDQRADLYGLGATLYELIAGRPAFEHSDPLQLLHNVLAQAPRPPCAWAPQIPQPLSDIVMRLLEKEPDRRYQSAEGLAHDLERLGRRLADGETGAFVLCEHDFAARLAAPAALIGRKHEQAVLQAALANAARGRARALLVAGAPGVGKSALVHSLRPAVLAQRGWFVAGRFDRQYQDLHSDAVHQALRMLGRLLLAETDDELARLRSRMRLALGANAGLIATLPEFRLLLGVEPQSTAHDDPHKVAQRRVQCALDLLRSIASPSRPLVLLLDDLQWAAALPLAFIDALLTDATLDGVLLVCAYRSTEVTSGHALAAQLSRWDRLAVLPPVLQLPNLPADDLGRLVGEMLRMPAQPAAALAATLAERCGGNPSDTIELIHALRHDGVLRRADGRWRWDAAEIRRHIGSGNVADLLAARIAGLPAATQRTLTTLACLGGEAGIELLAAASGITPGALQDHLAPAFEDGLLTMLPAGDAAPPALRFRHDRVLQAADDCSTGAGRQALQLTLARRLAPLPRFAGVAAAQYLAVVDALHEAPERQQVASLFRQAATQVRNSHAALAGRYLEQAMGLLAGDATPADPDLAAGLETELHAVLYSLGRLEEADAVFALIAARGAPALQRVDASCVQIGSLSNRGRPHEAVDLGLALLRELGFDMPRSDVAAQADRQFEALWRWVQTYDPASEQARPDLADARVGAAARLMNRLQAPAFFTDLLIVAWLVLESQRLWTRHGPCAALAANLSRATLVAIQLRQDYRTGYDVVRRVIEVSDARGYMPEASQARHLFAISSCHWFEPVENGIRHARLARDGLLQGGDLQNASFTYRTTIAALLDCAPTLSRYGAEIEAGQAFAVRTGNQHAIAVNLADRQLLRALRGETAGGFDDADFDSAAHLAGLADHPMAVASFHIRRALLAAIMDDTPALVRHAAAAQPLLPFILGFYPTALARLLQALALAEQIKAAAAPPGAPGLAGLQAELSACRDWMALRAADAPGNFRHLLHWIDAEQAWAGGDFAAASRLFDAALQAAAAQQRPWHNALIAERSARFMQAHGMDFVACQLLTRAHGHYAAWGASAKLRQLACAHACLQPGADVATVGIDQPAGVPPLAGDAIDMLAVLRTSQALGSQTSLDMLRQRVVELLAEMTGATRVQLVLWNDEARAWVLPQPVQDAAAACSLTLAQAAERGLLPLSVFCYAERTGQPLLVADAAHDERFSADPYLHAAGTCSLLVVPVLHQGQPRAMLMLENRLSRGAFTAARLDAVMLITGQLAVSLDNALLYQRLEQRVQERTLQLQQTQAQLLDAARLAGMAEIATNVLHNVGNVLNSVNVSAGLIGAQLRGSRLPGLARAVGLLDEHADDLAAFVAQDPRGKLLPGYLRDLVQVLQAEHQALARELRVLDHSIDHIKEVVATQQSYAGAPRLVERLHFSDLLSDALRMNAGALTRHKVEVVQAVDALPALPLDRHRLLQILVNLISNAKHALDAAYAQRPDRPCITLGGTLVSTAAGRTLRVTVADNGEGIAPQNLTRVFAHGFTTRKNGHGFGLHSCALAAQEMGGTLQAHSAGSGQGACFVLEIPIDAEAPTSEPEATGTEPRRVAGEAA